jgi:hypothetical protein
MYGGVRFWLWNGAASDTRIRFEAKSGGATDGGGACDADGGCTTRVHFDTTFLAGWQEARFPFDALAPNPYVGDPEARLDASRILALAWEVVPAPGADASTSSTPFTYCVAGLQWIR